MRLPGSPDVRLRVSVRARIGILYDGRNLGEHILHILEHDALGGAQAACPVDMLHHFLILELDSVEELAERL